MIMSTAMLPAGLMLLPGNDAAPSYQYMY